MKNELILSLGTEILYQGQPHIIKTHLSLTTFLLLNKKTDIEVVAELNTLSLINELPDSLLEGPILRFVSRGATLDKFRLEIYQ